LDALVAIVGALGCRKLVGMHPSLAWLLLVACVGCGSVSGDDKKDAAVTGDSRVADSQPDSPAELGTMANPAASCVELRTAGKATGVYWLDNPAAGGAAFETFCDQDRNGGGWALVYRSVRTTGSTTQFWQINYAQRLDNKGAAMPGANFYAPTIYRVGTEYMDTITDIEDKIVIAIVATATGFDTSTMKFMSPALSVGYQNIYANQFASGWSATDYDGDVSTVNCAVDYSGVAQHYGDCFNYSLGSDADLPYLDGGVGPHVANIALNALALATEPNGGTFSRVNQIERYARW
jgi:hypothetical protein